MDILRISSLAIGAAKINNNFQGKADVQKK
jgi:hypothetical protein